MGGFTKGEVFSRNQAIHMKGMIGEVGTGTCSSNAVTINAFHGLVTSESLSTAAGASQALTVTNSRVSAGDVALVTLNGGTSTTGSVEIKAVCTANTLTITLTNRHASAAFNGTFILGFSIVKAQNA